LKTQLKAIQIEGELTISTGCFGASMFKMAYRLRAHRLILDEEKAIKRV
jgi:hypothetical protein